MDRPIRIRRERTKGWRMPEGAVYVGRPSRWGNPFRVCTSKSAAVEVFETKLLRGELPITVHDVYSELHGKDLACWCLLTQPCHADVLLKWANPTCQHEGCEANTPVPCWLWDDGAREHVIAEFYCTSHCHEHGYCWWCGMFHAGIEHFDLAPDGLCSDCRHELTAEFNEDEHLPDEELGLWVDYPGDMIHGWDAVVEMEET